MEKRRKQENLKNKKYILKNEEAVLAVLLFIMTVSIISGVPPVAILMNIQFIIMMMLTAIAPAFLVVLVPLLGYVGLEVFMDYLKDYKQKKVLNLQKENSINLSNYAEEKIINLETNKEIKQELQENNKDSLESIKKMLEQLKETDNKNMEKGYSKGKEIK